MNTIKKLLSVAAIAALAALAAPSANAQSQVWYGGIISTGAVSVTSPATNNLIDTSKPPSQFVNPYIARDNSWFELVKDRGLSVQVAVGGTLTNCTLIIEGSNDPNNRTNWTNTRLIAINLPTTAGVIQTNIAASFLLNTRAVRLSQLLGTNGAGTFVVTNVLLGSWK
jgi:hypothetical protein